VDGLSGHESSARPGCSRGWQASGNVGPNEANTDESKPQRLVFSSAQQGGTTKSWIGITTPVQVLLPHGTVVGWVPVPAVPARPTVLPPAEPIRPPLPPTPTLPAELAWGSEALPPQAGAANAASTPQALKRRTIRQDIERQCSTRGREMRALPAATHAPPEHELRVNPA